MLRPLALLFLSVFLPTLVWAQAPTSTTHSSRAVNPERLVSGAKVYGKHPGMVTASGFPFRIAYTDSREPRYHFSMSCEDFLTQTKLGKGVGEYIAFILGPPWDGGAGKAGVFRTDQEGVRGDEIYQGIQVACALETVAAEIWRQEGAVLNGKRRVEEEDRLCAQVEEAWQKKHAEIAVEFRDGVIAAWRAADESDPFASIRGDFDLSSPTAAWETSLQLPDAEQCFLLKTPPAAGIAASFWTFACQFRASSNTYERIVESVQSALNLTYQPDETVAYANQVFFSDSSKPGWKLVVSKIGGASLVLLRVTPPQLAAVIPDALTAGLTASNRATQSTDLPVRDEIEKIRSGRYSPLPPAQVSPLTGPTASGKTSMTVRNSTQYALSVYFFGPVSRSLSLSPGASQIVDLAPGVFRVAGRAAASNVLPFYGEETYASSTQYTVTFYIGR